MSVLTLRDVSLLRWLAKYGLLSTSQISLYLFPGVQASTVLRRLRALEKEKWIYRMSGLESGEWVWLLGKKGEIQINATSSMIKPNRNSVAHDVELTQLRIRLGQIGLGDNFIPEWVTKRKTFDPNRRSDAAAIIPDGLFSATLWNQEVKTIALELEINPKSIQRYDKIFSKYMKQQHLDLIWYFVKTPTYGQALFGKWRVVQKKNWSRYENLVFTVVSEFEANPRRAKVHLLDGRTEPIERLFALPAPAQPVGGVNPEKAPGEAMKTAS